MRAAIVACLAVVAGCGRPTETAVLEYEVDIAAGRAAGTLAADVTDDQAREAIRARIELRLSQSGGPLKDASATIASSGRLEVRVTAHELDAPARAWVRRRMEVWGELRFALVAHPADGPDLEAERARLLDWLGRHPKEDLAAFDHVPPSAGGPHADLTWVDEPSPPGEPAAPLEDRALALLEPPGWPAFGAEDLERLWVETDDQGYAALGFELDPARSADFTSFTSAHIGRQLAVALDGRVLTRPMIHNGLPGSGLIMGRFTNEEADALACALGSGPLAAPLRFVDAREERSP